jgi:branched-chain amino acid transport system ATP-binding protein
VLLGDRDITAIPSFQRVNQGIAFLSQGRSVFPDLSVHENLEIGGWALQKNKAQMKAQVEAVYDRYPVLKTMRNRPGGSLSGGQQRILEFARMMVADPKIILIDEPSVGLAPILVDQVYQEIANLKKENRTILLVDQNVRAAVALADYIYTLEYGRNNLQGETGKFEGALEELIKSWLRF